MTDASAVQTDDLPSWDLSDLYKSPDDPAIQSDFHRAETMAKSFAATYAGRLATSPGGFRNCRNLWLHASIRSNIASHSGLAAK